MSRKGVIAKRVKAAPDGHIENQRPNAQSGWPRNECSALGQTASVRLKSRPKSKTRPITHHDPGNSRGRPRHNRHATTAHDQSARAGSNASRPRNSLTYHGRTLRPSRETMPRVRPKTIGQFLSADHAGRRHNIRPDRSDSAKTRLSGRSSRRPSERRGRPEAVFEAQSAQFKPKAGADLARLGLAASYT
ncbi:unnamed protein product [Microthlaspi erraticum]|uniref:Uncharacterized protein n=1 Tax=Microthlaspi erraticum TaxID=1685480 RepID=A0A6D2KCZ6_9BRAS|nr:unnamed protein product [Microthlaspi erraticum]